MPINPERRDQWRPVRDLNRIVNIAPENIVIDELPTNNFDELVEILLNSGEPTVDAYAGTPSAQRDEAERIARQLVASQAKEETKQPRTDHQASIYDLTHYVVQRETLTTGS